MAMPEEDDITKQQLWSRIDTVLETVGTVARNMADNLNNALPAFQRTCDDILVKNKILLTNLLSDVKLLIDNKTKTIEKLNNDGYGRMVTESSRLKKEVDQRLQSMRESLDEEISKKLADQIQQISLEIKNFNDSVVAYKKASDNQIFSLQKETGEKLGKIQGLFDGMKIKFKKITEQLQ